MEAAGLAAREVVDARKQPMDASAAQELVAAASTVVVGRGARFERFPAAQLLGDPEAFRKVLGPTGNLRAPTLRLGKTLVVGYSEPMYEELLG